MIVELFKKLSESDKKELLYAFETGNNCIKEIDGYFVGVNIRETDKYKIEYKEKEWCAGKL